MARPSRKVECSQEDKDRLIEIANSRNRLYKEILRAKIVLACIDKEHLVQTSQRLDVSTSTIMRWKNRFIEFGINGLGDFPHTGRPQFYSNDFQQNVLKTLEQAPPAGYGQWTGGLLAKELKVSKHAVWRFLRAKGINLARKRSWCVSTDPEFVAKAADVVGLYLSPPENAFVLCIDEKPNIQALKRKTGYVLSSDKKLIHGIESTYKRNGTINLFAALEVATGKIHGQTTPSSQKTKKGFIAFLEGLIGELPESSAYHVIIDNHSIHKRHEAWLEEHPNVFFHYTPTSASWLNMVEIWFGILASQSLRGASFANTEKLCTHISAFIESYNPTAKPFIWRKREVKGTQLKNIARNFCN